MQNDAEREPLDPHVYAKQRAAETGIPYVVSHMGHAMAATPLNLRLMENELGGIAAVYIATVYGPDEVCD